MITTKRSLAHGGVGRVPWPAAAPRIGRALALLVAGLIAAACGGSSTPTNPSTNAPTVTFTSTGITPVEVRISAGGTVTFLNNDSRPHAVSSDPLTIHTDCPAINDVGTLNPGQSRGTGVLTIRRTCGFHDHTNETDTRWYGRIIVE
jgi:plastocyanin